MSDVRIPMQAIVCLIAEEIKSCYFFSRLRDLGLDDTFFQSDLATIILESVGFDNDAHESMALYTTLLYKYSENIEQDYDALMAKAHDFYLELTAGIPSVILT